MNDNAMMRFGLVAVIGLASVGSPVAAQGIVVQQPLAERFELDTTLSVPDRGSAFLGGVGRSASGRAQYGPWPYQSSIGSAASNSTSHVSVHVHDLQLLDRMLLAEGAKQFATDSIRSSPDPRVQRVRQLWIKQSTPGAIDQSRQSTASTPRPSSRENALETLKRYRKR